MLDKTEPEGLDVVENQRGSSRIFFQSLKKGQFPEVVFIPVINAPKEAKEKPKDEKPKFDKHGRPITWVSIGRFNLFKARAKPKPSDEANSQTEQTTLSPLDRP